MRHSFVHNLIWVGLLAVAVGFGACDGNRPQRDAGRDGDADGSQCINNSDCNDGLFALALNAVIPMRMVLAIVGVYRVAVIRALKRERAMSPRTDA